MALDPKIWTRIDNAFLPFEPVAPERLDDWFVERPNTPLPTLLRELDPERGPKRIILVGQPASGKSSELVKLAHELNEQHRYLVVRLSLEDNLDVARANPVEVLFLMGAAAFKVANAELAEDAKPDRAKLEDLARGLESIVRTQTNNKTFSVDLTALLAGLLVFGAATLAPVAVLPAAGAAATVGAVSGGSVLKKFLSPFKFVSGTDIETVRKLEVEPQVEAMVQSLNVLLTDIEQRGQRPLALIVDGLDKLRDTDAISANFLERRALSAPVCRVVYTAPLDLFYSPVFGSVRAMFPIRPFPHVKLYQRDDVTKEYEEGYVFMDEVVRRRLKTCGHLAETIMPTHVLRTLIAASGGVMRDLIRLVQNAALKADLAGRDQIDDVDAREAAAELRRQLDAQLTPKYREVLRKVNETHQRTDDEECDTLLRSDIVLSYVNKDVWFDSHSALRIPV